MSGRRLQLDVRSLLHQRLHDQGAFCVLAIAGTPHPNEQFIQQLRMAHVSSCRPTEYLVQATAYMIAAFLCTLLPAEQCSINVEDVSTSTVLR